MAVSSWDAMNFILYSDVNDRSISQSLGRPEYSYYFVLKAYRPVLESLGRVHVVASGRSRSALSAIAQAGQESLFPVVRAAAENPDRPRNARRCACAWEYDSIPTSSGTMTRARTGRRCWRVMAG
jgi:hypothetical protein